MNEQERHRIANILVQDSVVIQKWQQLWDELGLGRGGTHFTTWSTAMKNGTGVYDELFKAMLALWVQEVNPNADVEALCEKLKSIKCLYTAQQLLDLPPAQEGSKSETSTTVEKSRAPNASKSTTKPISFAKFITRNLGGLVNGTTPSDDLLMFYVQNEIISHAFKEEIEKLPTAVKTAERLFTQLKKCPESEVDLIVEGLEEYEGNKMAVEILKTFQSK